MNSKVKPRHFTLTQSHFIDSNSSGLGTVAVFRRRGASRIEVGGFLVDRFCLGVRDAWFTEIEESELQGFRDQYFKDDCVENGGAWGRKLVEGAVEYARQLGFKPSNQYKKAARVFGGIKPEDCEETFVFGMDGKPFYMPLSDDSPETTQKILRHLEVRCGKGNFHYLVELREESLTDSVNELVQRFHDGSPEGVEAELHKLLKENPTSSSVYHGLAMTASLQGKHEKSLSYLNEAVRLSPEISEIWYNKGIAHKKLLQIVPMTIAFREALRDPDLDAESRRTAEGLVRSVADNAREEFDLDLDTYLLSGIAFDSAFQLMREQKWTEAVEYLKKSIQLNPRSNQAHGNLGTCLIQLGRNKEARAGFQESLRISPDYDVARENLKVLEGLAENELPHRIMREVNASPHDPT